MTLNAQGCVTLGGKALRSLHQSLKRDHPQEAAQLMQGMGYAAGTDLHAAFAAWLPTRTDASRAAELAVANLGAILTQFFNETGWGSVTLESLSPAVLAVDAEASPEVDREAGYDSPGCFVMSGMLAELLGGIAGSALAVMEVECQSLGGTRCRFLVGAPESLKTVYQHMSQGGDYTQAIA